MSPRRSLADVTVLLQKHEPATSSSPRTQPACATTSPSIHTNMPRKPSSTTGLVRQVNAARVGANQARREAEAPMRAGRRPVAEALRRATLTVERWQQKVADQLHARAYGFGGWKLDDCERHLAAAERTLRARLTDLRVYDQLHNIEANYTVPVLDRDAVKRDAITEREKRLADIRECMARDGYNVPTRPST
jgi:hypothetical protein